MKLGKTKTSIPQNEAVSLEAVRKVEEWKIDGVEIALDNELQVTLRDRVVEALDPDVLNSLRNDEMIAQIENAVSDITSDLGVTLSGYEQTYLARQIADDLIGMGPLQKLMDDDTVSDIMVNGPNLVFVERRGRIYRTDVKFRDINHIRIVAQKMARFTGRRVDELNPLLDARLPDGSRVNVVLPPIALDSPVISIRRVGNAALSLDNMVRSESMSLEMGEFLKAAAASRLNIIVSGGTGSGKTTLLNALSQYIDSGERIVTIEDAAELRLKQPHVVRMETRPATVEGTAAIEQRHLVKNSLRMRPDRIILGETRGSEAFDLLQAMNTGHDGSLATLHANTARDALARLENMVMMAGYELPLRVIRSQIASAVDLIVHVDRMSDGTRRVVSITEVTGTETDLITTQELFNFEITEVLTNKISGVYQYSGVRPRSFEKFKRHGHGATIERLLRAGGE